MVQRAEYAHRMWMTRPVAPPTPSTCGGRAPPRQGAIASSEDHPLRPAGIEGFGTDDDVSSELYHFWEVRESWVWFR